MKYFNTKQEAVTEAEKNLNFEYISGNEDICIFKTPPVYGFIDKDGQERQVNLSCVQSTEKVDQVETLDQLDWTDYIVEVD